ncbi:DUF6252 family protein [Flavobacterium litorale]|uniref:Uncharacterized protein n=1 Tax=Flavobacterium litorale TaxID=2856519 RepID=A0ABX8V7J5_9FLAO|nr:DUF6252 family protein [Flavobacterium litorale]QYJ68093.1 hypothetical protein K1I41_11240 [Flavobacterium litorale]
MKRINILSAFFVLIAALGFVSCDTEPVDPVFLDFVPDTEEPASFKVTIDGELFTANATQAAVADGIITIVGQRGTNGEFVSVTVAGTTVGSYPEALLTYNPSDESDFGYWNIDPDFNNTGGVTITAINTQNNTISGTFQYVGYWSDDSEEREPVELNNGTFTNIPYTGSLTDPDPDPDDEYFRATIDGDEKNYGVILSLQSGESVTLSGQIIEPANQIQLLMPIDITPGTYALEDGTDTFAIYSDNGETLTITTGELTVISNADGFIKGEFTFSALDADDNVVEITNGEFNIEL